MARKRKRKSTKKTRSLRLELLGLLFIFLSIFGSGASAISDGAIPGWMEHFFQFFLGIWYFVASVFLFITGVLLLVKRKYPNFWSRKMVGFYILFAGILLLSHIQTIESLLVTAGNVSIIGTTWNNFLDYVSGTGTVMQMGGGMIGAVIFTFCNFLFSLAGSKIVAVFSILIGLIFITDISIGDLFAKLFARIKKITENQFVKWKDVKAAKKQQKEERKLQDDVVIDELQHDEPVINDFTDIAYATNETEKEPVHAAAPLEEKAKQKEAEEVDDVPEMAMTETENPEYILPSPNLLADPAHNSQQKEKSQIQATVRKLEQTFKSFGVKARITKVHVGPAVTKYEVYPEAGVKVSKIVGLHDDLALALAAKDIRIEAPIPGKSAVGIEVPNQEVAMVSLREVLDKTWNNKSAKLLYALGRDISGEAVVGELNKMPHLLIAGATGSGKSVCVNGIITSILMRTKPHEVKMMMIDPKKVELNVYNGIPHLLAPVVTDPKKASRALKKVVSEMERRYDLFTDTGTRNIEGYNEYIRKYNLSSDETQPHLPYIVVLVDELADLMMVASNDVEDSITRLAQMARAAGIHLIIATQRPSVDVITGVIKANIPSRIAFSVSSQIDSRTILDSGGAEKLLGRGDMLFMPVGSSKPTRVQGAFLSDEEVERVVDHCIEQQKASYQEEMIPEDTNDVVEEVDDELYEDAVQMIIEMQSASVSMLQRRFRIGYTRAARLIDAMEARGIVGPYEGSKPRTVLVSQAAEEKTM
ncbi:FtsK/SpoIIIE family DNA translocase [Oceanobacillus polygoni]|uniref:S-DNA-T family DNA segregation ATPase FtsK/SpoIIIE n=1 Tax=Oceanobacillus polygoni TaxID=1235259 RepID=A0A9X1CH43_9BACI|nr:DNA translocase FtsK [Oceanobacillus polygoni]MBP2077713.1 S-DNA-T family DNA segregation ATPase FtsK/SpoIIIE [Oceanobacillus polygoni]